MDSYGHSSRRPPLSILVPNSLSIRPNLPSPAKQKRLFPIACRLVSTDQWFTTRVDRTWQVMDLKVWLLSKALPPHVLPLPPSYRPSSPVTFAAAPPTATAEIPTAIISASPSLDDTASSEGTDDVQDQVLSRPRRDLTAPQPTSLSIPYSYNTGAPAISGIEALKNRHPGPSADTSEFVQNILQIAEKWSLYAFSMGGMLLVDSSPLSEYSLNPHELLELHRAGAYVPLPRTILPALPDPVPFPVAIGYTRTASARAAASASKPKPEKAKPSKSKSGHKSRKHALQSEASLITASSSSASHNYPHHGQLSSTSSECESDQDADEFEEIYGSPYAQPYYDGWANVLRIRGLSSAKRAGDKGKGRDEEIGVSRCDSVDSPGPTSSSTGTETWKKMWIVVRESRISIRRYRGEDEDESWFVGNCVGLYGLDKLKYLLGHDPPSTGTMRQHHRPQTSTSSEPFPYRVSAHSNKKTVRPGKDLTICAKFTEDSGGSRWLFLKMLDSPSHEHLLRIIHRLAYTSPLRLHSIYPNPLRHSATQSISQSLSQGVDLSSSLPPLHHHHFRPTTHTMRTLRTEFLPNPIPHPLALSFSAPSPLTGQDDVSDEDLPLPGGGRRRSLFDTTDLASGDETYDDDELVPSGSHAPASTSFTSSYGMGLGSGMGVRFPEWREEVLIRAINAGLGGGVGMGGLDRREYVSYDRHHFLRKDRGDDDDSDSDSSVHQGSGSNHRHTRPMPPSRAQDSMSSFHTRSSSLSKTAVNSSINQDGLGVLGDTDSDTDSEAGSEREWEGWAYDLDRLKGVRYPRARAAGGGGGSDEDYEQHYHHHLHHNTTTTAFTSSEKKMRKGTGRRDRAKTMTAGKTGVGFAPTPMPTPIIPSPPSPGSGTGGDLFTSFSAFRLQQQQSPHPLENPPLPLSPTKVTSSTTLSSNSTITPERDDPKSRRNKGDGEDDASKPSSPTTSISTKISPLTRARSATVSAVAAVRSPTAGSFPSSNAQAGRQISTSSSKTKSSDGVVLTGSGSEWPRTAGEDVAVVGNVISPSGSGPGSGIGMKNLMRGLSMKAGKESLMKGLENALDFVEGK